MIVLIILFLFSLSYAHSLKTEITYSDAVIIKIKYSDGTPFSYEKYEIYSPEDEVVPFQVGRTDREGRIVFVPDVEGKWKVKAFSEDGHGFVKILDLEDMSIQKDSNKAEFLIKTFSGIVLIFLIYLIFYLYLRRWKGGKKG
ncbi:hypothetical protein [Persephonella sp.]